MHRVELSKPPYGAMRKTAPICAMPAVSGTKNTGFGAYDVGTYQRKRRKLYPVARAAAIPTKSPLVVKETRLSAVSRGCCKRHSFVLFRSLQSDI